MTPSPIPRNLNASGAHPAIGRTPNPYVRSTSANNGPEKRRRRSDPQSKLTSRAPERASSFQEHHESVRRLRRDKQFGLTLEILGGHDMGQLGDNEVDGADDYIGILDEEQPGVTPSAVVQEMTGDDDDGDVASVVCRLFQVAFLLQNSPETLQEIERIFQSATAD